MEVLENTDWSRLNELLKSLYTPCRLGSFPAQLMNVLPSVIGSEILGIVNFSFEGKAWPQFITFPDPSVAVAAEKFIVSPQNFFAHPVANQYAQTLSGRAMAISDLLSESEFYRQDLPYKAYLRYFGIEDQMGIFFELPHELKVFNSFDPFHQGQEKFCLMLSRDRRNFTEHDRLVLNLIRPHLKQAYKTLVAFSQVHHQLSKQQSATDQAALIALSTSGAVSWMTRQAGAILHRYFPPSKAHITLPDLLQQWVGRQLSMFAQLEEVCRLARPLRLQQEGRRLVIRFSYCRRAEQLYLLLEETETEQLSVDSLQLLGLTKREAEVLFWVAKDKSPVEVAKLLGMSDRTVKKHFEHIYEKFGVQTRLSAVMYALEHLGIFS